MTALPKARRTDSTIAVSLRLEPRFRSEQGARDENQDAAKSLRMPDGVCGIVADGMGGGVDGSLFSERTVEQVAKSIDEGGTAPLRERVERAVRAAVEDVRALQQSDPRYESSGSTLVMAAVCVDKGSAEAVIAHIGDSRAYHISAGGVVRQLTRDHNYAEELMVQGVAPDQARKHDFAHHLTHSLGEALELDSIPDLFSSVSLQPGDHLLLCTDGVTKVLSSTELAAAVVGRSAQEAADIIVQRALEQKSRDNATALVIQCIAVRPRPAWNVQLLATVLVLGVVLVGVMAGIFIKGAPAQGPAGTPLLVGASPAATSELPTDIAPTGKPTSTIAPTLTATPTPTPTLTPTPTPTFTPRPTFTPQPTRAPIRQPTVNVIATPGNENGSTTPAAATAEPSVIPMTAIPVDTPVTVATPLPATSEPEGPTAEPPPEPEEPTAEPEEPPPPEPEEPTAGPPVRVPRE